MAKKKAENKSNQMWGGRFSGKPAGVMTRLNASISFDKKLYKQDIRGSIAHAKMLSKQGIISKKDEQEIIKGLGQVEKEIESGKFQFKEALEDIHMNIESRLSEIIGEPAGRLHTARSRNDQVAVDLKLWVRDEAKEIDALVKDLQKALIKKADENVETIMPGFTHLQVAQPVVFGHHLLAYVEMLGRDRSRIKSLIERLDECPLGAAALAGTGFNNDRNFVAKELGFKKPTANSMDSVSDRDFALELISTLSILMMHLSRFAEEVIIWCSQGFGFVTLSDEFSTGSSIMPQKKNPDSAELIRGKTGRVYGSLMALLTTMKALPLTYSKDMQEDKEAVFDAVETAKACLQVASGMTAGMSVNKQNMLKAASGGFSTATDLADFLVRELKIPFRSAHHITGSIVKIAEQKKVRLDELNLKDIQKVEPKITAKIFDVLTVEKSVASRKSTGGTAPTMVKKAIAEAKKKYL